MSCSCEHSTCCCGTPCPCYKDCLRCVACVKSKNFQCALCKEPFHNEDEKPVGKVCICFTAHSNVENRLNKESSRPSARLTPSFIGFQPVCFSSTLIPGKLSNKDIEHHLNDSNSDSKSLPVAMQNHANGTMENSLSYASVLKFQTKPLNPKASTCHSDSILSNSHSDAVENLHQASTENKTLPSKLKPNCMLNSKLSFLDGVDSETSVSYQCKTCHKPLYFEDIPMQRLEANSVCNCFVIRSKEFHDAKEFTNVPHEPDTNAASSMPPSGIVPVTSVNNEMNSNDPVPELMNSNPTADINVPANIVPVPMIVILRPMFFTSNVPPRNNAPSYASVLGNVSNTTHESTRNNLKDESYNASIETAEKAKPQNVCSFNSSIRKTLQTNFQAPARMSSEYSEACAHVMPRMTPPSSQTSNMAPELCDFKENVCDSCYLLLESKKRVASEIPLPGLQTFETKVNNDSAATLNNTRTEGLKNDPPFSHSQTNIDGSHFKKFQEDTENPTELVDFETLKKNLQYAKAARDKYMDYLSAVTTKYSRHTQM